MRGVSGRLGRRGVLPARHFLEYPVPPPAGLRVPVPAVPVQELRLVVVLASAGVSTSKLGLAMVTLFNELKEAITVSEPLIFPLEVTVAVTELALAVI